MSKTITFLSTLIALLAQATLGFTQETAITISGRVVDIGTGQSLSGVSVSTLINDESVGTRTGEDGQFTFVTSQPVPFTLYFTQLGYETTERTIRGNVKNLVIQLEPENILGQEVVVSASRFPEPILESPVSVERLSSETLRRTASLSYYDEIPNLKGVDVSIQSLTFKSLNTRGFNSNGNTRFNQLIDGMDNQAPGLNFSLGNIVGISDLDIDNIELLPGASSALYGAGGTNGTLLMTSKNPFTSPGLTAQLRMGVNEGGSLWPDMSVRYAKVINPKLAFKVTGSYLSAKDWEATDYSNFDRTNRTSKAGDRNSDPSYDGVNVYGDEFDLKYPTLIQVGAFARQQAGQVPADALPEPLRSIVTAYDNNLLPASSVTRTGYLEKDLVDYDAKSIKTSAALHYKIADSTEAVFQANWGIGTSIYTGSDRYSLRNFNVGQYKLELNSKNFFVRGYTTQERSGDAYNATLLANLMNEASKSSVDWYQQYTSAFSVARLNGVSEPEAHLAARAVADNGRPVPGSDAFNALKRKISNTDIGPENGAKFNDKSNLYHLEGMYNFSNDLNNDFEFLVGASYRRYALNSDGTVFDDLNRDININEYGAYTQIGKKITDYFKLTGSMRYDKNENFEGRLTPRVTGVWTVSPNENIRASFQTGFRNPTAQNQYIDIAAAGNSIRLIGGLPEIIQKYGLHNNKGYTVESYRQFLTSGNPADLKTYTFDPDGIAPERVQAFELGYKGLFSNNLLVDTYAFYNVYRNYITGMEVYQNPTPGDLAGLQNLIRYNVPINNPGRVTSWGMALGLDYRWSGFGLTGNFSYNKLGNLPEGYFNDYNTPEVRFNLGFSARELFKNVGFHASYRWQNAFLWQSPFVSGEVPAFGTVAGHFTYKLPVYNTTLQVGGSNLLNNRYRTSFGNPQVGGMYYVSLLFDQFFK